MPDSAHNTENSVAGLYAHYARVWAALIVLTAVTVSVSYADMPNVAITTAVLIATVKASLVLLYFMHLRFAGRMYFYMILIVLVTYGVFLGLTFSDYGFR